MKKKRWILRQLEHAIEHLEQDEPQIELAIGLSHAIEHLEQPIPNVEMVVNILRAALNAERRRSRNGDNREII